MAAATATANILNKILLLWSKPIPVNFIFPVTEIFPHLLLLNQYVCGNITTTDLYLLAIPRVDLEGLVNDPVYQFPQVEVVYVYYENNTSYEQEQTWFQIRYPKLRFCHERDLPKIFDKSTIKNAVDPSKQIDRVAINIFAASVTQRLSAKGPAVVNRHLSTEGFSASTSSRGFSIRNIESISERFICPICRLILREPHQLKCGHRICQACVDIENNEMRCLLCLKVTPRQNIWLDKAFRKEMEQLLICCAVCDSTQILKRYQEHLDQDHQEHMNTSDVSQTDYSSILNSLRSMHTPDNNNQHQNSFSQIQDRITILSNIVNALNNDQQRIRSSLSSSQNHLQIVSQEMVSLRSATQDNVCMANGMKTSTDFIAQDIWSLKLMAKDRMSTSIDGTLLWKITSIKEKIADALSERTKSIYSPAFYSSPSGYKMCARLYLNGDGNTRGKYLSLFFVLMRGDFDPILHWPFSYNVAFELIDQSTSDDNRRSNIKNDFWPDTTLPCFQCPSYSMNEASGINNFFSLELLRKYFHLYIRDNVMFIRITVSFLEMRPESLGNTGTGSIANDDIHVDTINDNIMHMS